MQVKISDIKIGIRKRSLKIEYVNQLAESIKELGLLNPITLSTDYRLLSGMHRLEAVKLLGWVEIESRIMEITDALHEELTEIDENLIRNDLAVLERSEQLLRRKQIYEQIYPETKQGGDRKSDEYKNQNDNLSFRSFAQDTAEKTGLSQRSIQREIQIANNIDESVKDIIRDTEIADNKSELLALARIKDKEKQQEIANKVINGETVKEAIAEIKKEERIQVIESQNAQIESGLDKPIGLYDVIVIDPAWDYGTKYDPDGRRAASPYPEMSIEEIKAIELPSKDDCIIWLWTTHKYMRFSFDILDSWGFRDVMILTWDKGHIGLGSWLRSQSEFCIMAVKGIPIINLTNQSTILKGEYREHSRKPNEFYEMVDSLCIGRKLDYFAREQRNGWDRFGVITNFNE